MALYYDGSYYDTINQTNYTWTTETGPTDTTVLSVQYIVTARWAGTGVPPSTVDVTVSNSIRASNWEGPVAVTGTVEVQAAGGSGSGGPFDLPPFYSFDYTDLGNQGGTLSVAYVLGMGYIGGPQTVGTATFTLTDTSTASDATIMYDVTFDATASV